MGQILGAVEGRIQSEGLRDLQKEIRKTQNDPKYQKLLKELPGILSSLQGAASVTIGVNLDSSLRPVQATLLSVHDKPFTGRSLLNRLFGARSDREGIAPLHSASEGPGPAGEIDPLMVPLFADLAKVLEETAIPIAGQLSQYADLHGRLFMDIRQALIFYLGAVRIIRRFEGLGLSSANRMSSALPVSDARVDCRAVRSRSFWWGPPDRSARPERRRGLGVYA